MIWYIENHQRFKQEREALEALAARTDWLTPIKWRIDDSARVAWDADISVPAGHRPVSLIYPNHFPFSPPLVVPRGDATRWSQHQWGPGNELCLEYGPDNWHQDISGADMIESAHRLLEGEQPEPGVSAEVASRHAMTLGQDLRGVFSRFLLTRPLTDELRNLPEAVMAVASAAGIHRRGDCVVYVIESLTLPDGRTWKDEVPDIGILGFADTVAVFRWPGNRPFPATHSLTAFRAAIGQAGLVLPDVSYVMVASGNDVRSFFLNADGDSLLESAVIPAQPSVPRLDKDHEALAGRKVALVGCGSLGSKIAVMLARSGVGKFLLVDDDLFFPDNLVRHDLDWRDVGIHKADSVARRIALVNPTAAYSVRKHRLGGQESSGGIESLLKSLGASDLIIDATAEAKVFNYLCAAVAISKKLMVWAEVFGGGFGGLIARHRPSKEPDPASMRRAIENWCADQGKVLPRPVHRYGGEPDAPAIADDADVTVIAGHAARMAIDLLIPRDPSSFPHSVYMIGLAEGWIFGQPFETRPIDVGPPAPEPEDAGDSAEAEMEFEFVKRLFSEYEDAASGGTASNPTPGA
ncbi:MAG: ThiF family adenylyltransferase [Bryobacteraceae bacterium]